MTNLDSFSEIVHNGASAPCLVAFGNWGHYYIQFDNGAECWNFNNSEVEEIFVQYNILSVHFGSKGKYFIVCELANGRTTYQTNMTGSTVGKIRSKAANKSLKQVLIDPTYKTWFIRYS
jgi:hypothetical protein